MALHVAVVHAERINADFNHGLAIAQRGFHIVINSSYRHRSWLAAN